MIAERSARDAWNLPPTSKNPLMLKNARAADAIPLKPPIKDWLVPLKTFPEVLTFVSSLPKLLPSFLLLFLIFSDTPVKESLARKR